MPDPLNTIEGLMTEARHFYETIKGDPTAYQVTTAQAATLLALVTGAETGKTDRDLAKEELVLKSAVFKAAIEALEEFLRPLRQSVKDNPATTDVQREQLHLLTDGGDGESIANALASAPLLLVEQSGIRQHTVRFFMQGEDSDSTRKPKGVKGCNIYVKVGDELPTSVKEAALITMDTKSPYNYTHEPEDIGKKAHYIALWVNNDDEKSPQSETFSVTVTG